MPGPGDRPLYTAEPLTLADLSLLAELFYLPYEYGPAARSMLQQLDWLKTHSTSSSSSTAEEESPQVLPTPETLLLLTALLSVLIIVLLCSVLQSAEWLSSSLCSPLSSSLCSPLSSSLCSPPPPLCVLLLLLSVFSSSPLCSPEL